MRTAKKLEKGVRSTPCGQLKSCPSVCAFDLLTFDLLTFDLLTFDLLTFDLTTLVYRPNGFFK